MGRQQGDLARDLAAGQQLLVDAKGKTPRSHERSIEELKREQGTSAVIPGDVIFCLFFGARAHGSHHAPANCYPLSRCVFLEEAVVLQ